MTVIQIEGAGYPIEKVFSDDFLFNIPHYQRPYAWTTEETEQLLIDLIDALGDETTDINKIPPYFLGNIVLIKPIDKSESEVLDGQQRLTTLTILFAVLRKLLPKYKDDLENLICQPEKLLSGTPERPRLKLRERDRDFFEKYIQDPDGIEKLQKIHLGSLSDSKRNIVKNTRLLLERIAEELPDESQKIRLTQFLSQRCYLVVVHTPNFDSAYKIFSVLNDRGLDLSITDILKADIIGKLTQPEEKIGNLTQAKEEKYTRKWEDLEERLGRQDFTELFSYIRMIYARKKLESSVLKSFQTHVVEREENKDPCYLIDKVIEPYALALDNINNFTFASTSNASEINQLFRWLQRISHSDWIAPAILYLTKYQYEPEQLLKFFTDLERLAAGLTILKLNITKRIKRYVDIIKAIEDNSNLYADNSPLQLSKEEQQEICDRINGDIYNNYKARNARQYILLRLDDAISDGTPNYDSYKKITIEHVLPQNPKADSQWLSWFSSEEKEKYLHGLSNLILLSRSKNSSASNYDFQLKKEKYFNSPVCTFALTVQVLKEQKWTPEIVKNRQKYLFEELKRIWRLNSSSIYY